MSHMTGGMQTGGHSPGGNPTYSVKYLGIVDGSMGILSRKMMLQGAQKDNINKATEIMKVN